MLELETVCPLHVLLAGVRQGCSLFLLLYLIYDEAMNTEATDNMEAGISVDGRIINTIRHADDEATVANCQKGLQQLTDNPNKVTREFGIKINVKTTKVICISLKRNNKLKIYVDGQQVEQVSQSRYLRSLISENGYCTKEIRSRIEMTKKVFMEKKELLTGEIKKCSERHKPARWQ